MNPISNTGIFTNNDISSNTNQNSGINPVVELKTRQLRQMISTIPGVVPLITEVSLVSHQL